MRRRWIAATIACAAFASLPSAAAAGIPAWTTYHHDVARSGIDPDSTSPVTPSQVRQTPGRRCQATFLKLVRHLEASAGTDALSPRMGPLAPGRYLVTVIAIGSNGARSLLRSAVVVVRRG